MTRCPPVLGQSAVELGGSGFARGGLVMNPFDAGFGRGKNRAGYRTGNPAAYRAGSWAGLPIEAVTSTCP